MTEFSAEFNQADLAGLRAAIRRNPQKVLDEVNKFLVRGLSKYTKGIQSEPWRVGGSGGGAPVNTGNLRDTHAKIINRWDARVGPSAPYAGYVHRNRPWLDYVKRTKDQEIQQLEKELLENITNDLAK